MASTNTSALDLVNKLTDACVRKVSEANAGRDLTEEQLEAAVEQAFEVAFEQLMDDLEERSPGFAERFHAELAADYERAYGPQQ